MEKLLINTIREFKEANGIEQLNTTNSKEFIHELADWINHRKHVLLDHLSLIEGIGLSSAFNPYTAEVGKCRLDTIAKLTNTTIITPYTKGLEHIDSDRLIKGSVVVNGNMPLLVTKETIEAINSNAIITFFSHNPYTKASIRNWENLHNNTDYNIILSVFGSIYDKDYRRKTQLIDEFKRSIYPLFIEESTTINDTYHHIIASDKGIKYNKTKSY